MRRAKRLFEDYGDNLRDWVRRSFEGETAFTTNNHEWGEARFVMAVLRTLQEYAHDPKYRRREPRELAMQCAVAALGIPIFSPNRRSLAAVYARGRSLAAAGEGPKGK
jgi:hypothetical protein